MGASIIRIIMSACMHACVMHPPCVVVPPPTPHPPPRHVPIRKKMRLSGLRITNPNPSRNRGWTAAPFPPLPLPLLLLAAATPAGALRGVGSKRRMIKNVGREIKAWT